MENTTFNTYKTLVFITKEFDYQINFKVLKEHYTIRANYKLIDYDLLFNELSTYNNTKDQKKLLNTIYNFAKHNIIRYNDLIIHLTDIDFQSYYIQRENNFSVKTGNENEACNNFMKEPPLKNEYEYIQNYTNSDFINYCNVIIDYIDEMKPPISELTLKSICNEAELKGIRKTLIDEKIISKINEDDFLHHFTGQPMDEAINKIEFLPEFKGNAKRKRLYDTIVHLIDKKTLKTDDFNKIAYSFKDKKGNKIQLNYNDKQLTQNFNRAFLDFCDHAKKRLKP